MERSLVRGAGKGLHVGHTEEVDGAQQERGPGFPSRKSYIQRSKQHPTWSGDCFIALINMNAIISQSNEN